MKSNNILITGAGGFLGSYIARGLKSQKSNQDYQVFSFSRSHYPQLKNLGVTERLGDLRNYDDIYKALDGIDAVIHTAGMVGVWGRFQDFYQINVKGTENLLKAMKARNIKKLIYTSTPSVAFGKDDLCGVDESIPYPAKYLTHYALTKSIAEKMVLAANNDNGTDGLLTVALRPHLIFGPGDLNIIPRVIEAQKKGRLKIIGDGENLVDVIFVENAASAHIMALQKLDYGHPIAGKSYFLGQGPVRLWDFTNTILEKSQLPKVTKKISIRKAYAVGFLLECIYRLFGLYKNQPPMTRFIALQLGKSHYFNHHNIEKDLGFRPKVSVEEGIERLFV